MGPFVDATGGDRNATPRAETAACAAAWRGDGARSELETLVALFAIESAQPAIAKTKREGLSDHYRITGPATAYFELHEELDIHHAASGMRLIDARLDGADEAALLSEAERVLRANWTLLDGMARAAA